MSRYSYQAGVRIVGSKFQLNREALTQAIRTWPDGDYTFTLEEEDAKRSNQSNRYLWGPVYTAIHEYTGQPKEDIHDEMCVRFTTETIHYVNPKTGEIVEMEVVRRTSGMSVSRFHKFVQDVKLFAQEFFGLTFEDASEDFYKERDRAAARDAKRRAA